jgi:hypothetical protein
MHVDAIAVRRIRRAAHEVVVLVGGDDEQRVLLGDAIGLESIEEPRERRVMELELLDVSHFARTEPKQMSTGGRTILGHISKRGNSYLRMLFIQAARVILLRPANCEARLWGLARSRH